MTDEVITNHPNKLPKIEMDQVRMVKQEADDNGVNISLLGQRDLLIMDLGESVRYVGFKPDDVKAMVLGFMEGYIAMQHLKPMDKSSVN